MNADPLITNETQPTQTMAALVRADERLKKEFPLITLPVLILHGTLDKNTRPSGSQHFYDMGGSLDKTLKFYEGGFHDLLNCIDKEAVMQDIEDWIDTDRLAQGREIILFDIAGVGSLSGEVPAIRQVSARSNGVVFSLPQCALERPTVSFSQVIAPGRV
jgi:hypothetical protein